MSLFVGDSLQQHFPARTRRRGQEYFDRGFVSIDTLEPDYVEAAVEGSVVYFVTLAEDERDRNGVEMDCTCPAFSRFGPCKHLWAVILATEEAVEGGAFGGAWGETHSIVRAVVKAVGRGPVKETAEWARRLDGMARIPRQAVYTPSLLTGPEGQFAYELDVKRSAEHGILAVEVMHRQLRDNGRWGPLRATGIRAASVEASTTELDKSIFTKLRGASTLTNLLGWSIHREDSSVFYLEPNLLEEVLPLLVKAGRLYWRTEGDMPSESVGWDDGEPWSFEGKLDSSEQRVVLTGELVRGEARRSLDEPVVLLESGFVGFKDEIARFDPRGGMELVIQLRAGGPLIVPAEDRERFDATLAEFPTGLWRCLPWLPVPESAPLTPCLHIEDDREGSRQTKRLECGVSFLYGTVNVDFQDACEVLRGEDEHVIQRDRATEREALETLVQAGLRPSSEEWSVAGTVSFSDFPHFAHTLLEKGWRVEVPEGALRRSGASSVSVRSGIDWFELGGGLQFGDEIAAFPELLEAAREGRGTVPLGDGSVGLIPEQWLKTWSLLGLGEETEAGLRFPRQQGWMLDALLAERGEVNSDAAFDRYRAGLRKFQALNAKKEPASFCGALRDYQREGLGRFKFWRDLGLGGCLADDMGLGKTVQVLALLEAQRRSKKSATHLPSLVVAPRSVVFNWIDEAARFAPNLTVIDYTGPRRRDRKDELDSVDVVMTTYGTLRRDARDLCEREFEYVILDEAQAIKNATSQTAKAARLMRARNRLALSGTPVENHLGELWSLFEFLNPGMLGRAKTFQALMDTESPDGNRLAEAMRPFFLRRTKEEVLDDLPEKTEQVLHCDLGRKERKRYDELRRHYQAELLSRADDVGLKRMKIHVLEALLRLRQSACHPGLVSPHLSSESSAKLDALIPRLEETANEGHKALVFSQFTKLLAIVRTRLDALGIPYEYLDGRTRNRKERVERFQTDPDCPLFLISLKAGGQGLNLTAADNVFLLDPWWNPAVEAQAIDRAHRIGRQRPVFAYRVIARDTVEDRVLELQAKKRALAEALFAGKGGALRDLTRDDLEGLLS